MKNAEIYLREINSESWRECIELCVDESQSNFVSSNLFSLAQSKFETQRISCAIYNSEDVMVGFVMYNDKPLTEGGYRISRLMIDKKHQGRGYGVSAARQVLEILSQISECHEIRLDYHSSNDKAAVLWRGLGFVDCGKLGDNIELCFAACSNIDSE